MPGVDKECTTHHLACECRERYFRQLEKDNCKLAEENRRLLKEGVKRIDQLENTKLKLQDALKRNNQLQADKTRLNQNRKDLKRSFLHLQKKVSHGCTDTFCPECDK